MQNRGSWARAVGTSCETEGAGFDLPMLVPQRGARVEGVADAPAWKISLRLVVGASSPGDWLEDSTLLHQDVRNRTASPKSSVRFPSRLLAIDNSFDGRAVSERPASVSSRSDRQHRSIRARPHEAIFEIVLRTSRCATAGDRDHRD